jgi:hypothetical protein
MNASEAKAALLAEKCPCPAPEGQDAHKVGAFPGAPMVLSFLLPIAQQAVAQYGPQVLQFIEQAAQSALDALEAKLNGVKAS